MAAAFLTLIIISINNSITRFFMFSKFKSCSAYFLSDFWTLFKGFLGELKLDEMYWDPSFLKTKFIPLKYWIYINKL